MLQIFDLILDFFRMDHSPRPNDVKMQNGQLFQVKEIFAKKVVFWGPGLARDPLENQENAKDFQCWPSSVELGRARPAVEILNIRTRPASAEFGRARPRSAELRPARPGSAEHADGAGAQQM